MARLVQTPGGLVPADGKNVDGRGFYLCRDSECVRKAKKKHRIEAVAGMDESENILCNQPNER